MAALQRAEQPDNEYLLISQRGVPALLARLGDDAAASSSTSACARRAATRPVPTARAVRAYLAHRRPRPRLRPGARHAPVRRLLRRRTRRRRRRARDRPLPRGPPRLRLGRVRGRAARRAAHAAPRRRRLPRRPASRSSRRSTGRCATSRSGPPPRLGRRSSCSTTRRADGTASTRSTATSRRPARSGSRPATRSRAATWSAQLGDESENGGWAPHLHLQLLTTDLGRGSDAHGVGTLAERDVWESVSPDPNLLLGLPGGVRAEPPRATADAAGRPPHLALARAQPRPTPSR